MHRARQHADALAGRSGKEAVEPSGVRLAVGVREDEPLPAPAARPPRARVGGKKNPPTHPVWGSRWAPEKRSHSPRARAAAALRAAPGEPYRPSHTSTARSGVATGSSPGAL